ncbi:MAG TPA: LptA/OstA family protein [Afifellaceae bacterium]|nr:LptA/OstA family protein [Afifellaceae bacterium]
MRHLQVAGAAAGAMLMLALAAPAAAQNFGSAFTGFSTTSEEPIQIEADRLEVRVEEKRAVYVGNVTVRQGDTLLKTAELQVFYAGGGETPGASGTSLQRIIANGRVIVQSQNRIATGDEAVFEMADETIVLTGNVVLTEDENIVRGERLVVDLRTGEAQMQGGRVQTILVPGRAQEDQGGGEPR